MVSSLDSVPSTLYSTLYRGYHTKEPKKDPGTPSARGIKLSGQMEGISVRGDSRYTYALRIGERTKLVDRKTTVQARWRASASMVDTDLGDTEPQHPQASTSPEPLSPSA